jgi:hypothetical protein
MPRAELEARFTANSKQFQKEMGKVKKSTSKLGKSLAGLGGLVAGALSIRAMGSFIDKLDKIGKTADRIGITTDAMQKLSYAASITGSDIGAVERAFKRMSVVMFDAKQGSKTSLDAFKELGISFDDLKDKSPSEQFEFLIQKLGGVEDHTMKLALAQKFLGRSGAELIPFFEQYQKLSGEISASGGIINEETIRAAEKFNDSWTRITTSLQAFVANSGILDYIADLAENLANMSSTLNEIEKSKILAKKMGATGSLVDRTLMDDILEAPSRFLFGNDFVDKHGVGGGMTGSVLSTPANPKAQAQMELLKETKKIEKTLTVSLKDIERTLKSVGALQ